MKSSKKKKVEDIRCLISFRAYFSFIVCFHSFHYSPTLLQFPTLLSCVVGSPTEFCNQLRRDCARLHILGEKAIITPWEARSDAAFGQYYLCFLLFLAFYMPSACSLSPSVCSHLPYATMKVTLFPFYSVARVSLPVGMTLLLWEWPWLEGLLHPAFIPISYAA